MKNVNKTFPPPQFLKSSIDSIILKGTGNFLLMEKSPEYEKIYENFNNQFKLFLSKLPNSLLRKNVTDAYNKNLIFLGVSASTIETGLNSTFVSDGRFCYAYVLLANLLNIDVKTGDTNNIDECIYSAYQSIIRSAVILNKDAIKKDKDFHKLMATYFYLVVLKALGKENIYNEKQKNFIYIISLYCYYRNFLGERAGIVKSIIEKHFKDEKLIQFYDEFEPRFKDIDKYSTTKDLPRMLIDTKVIVEPPNSITMSLIKSLKLSGYYSLVGPLDMLVSMSILSKYPTDAYTRYSLVADKVQDAIETIVSKYVDKLKFKDTNLFK